MRRDPRPATSGRPALIFPWPNRSAGLVGTWRKGFVRAWLGWILVCCPAGWTASTLDFNWSLREDPAGGLIVELRSGNQTLLRLPAQERGWAETWAKRLVERLDRLAQLGTRGSDWSLKPQPEGFLLAARGLSLITVTEALARKSGASPAALAQAWLKNLQNAFNQPYLALPQREILVPQGTTVEVLLNGTIPGKWQVILEGNGCSRVQLQPSRRQLLVEGLKPGQEWLTLRGGGMELRVLILVRIFAGQIRPPVVATVTGQAPPAAFLMEAVRNALIGAAEVQPGSHLELGSISPPAETVGGGRTLQVQIPVKISGRDYVPFAATVPVTVRNRPWFPREAEQLIVSNDPENVRRPGLLAQGQLLPQQTNRLLYHHKNVSSEPLFWGVCIVNPTAQPAQVHIQHNVFGPNRDEIYVGHIVTAAFWRDRLQGNGYHIQIPPSSGWSILSCRVGPQAVISGLAEMTLQSEQPLICQVFADASYRTQLWTPPTRDPEPLGLVCRRPYKFQEASYVVGRRHTFIAIGKEPLISLSRRPLVGNYGVLYNVNLTLSNPTAQEAAVEIAFSADGGVARGVVVIDGQIRETGLVLASAEERLHQLTLPPYGKRRLRLQIMPQAGSNYPLRLIARPAGRK